ncbi:hypothetical protein J6590_017250 [Homalodisca vitripennis]|nr:hypothetical protein J6590_085252 [Homalodisca vitripennis]KAG8259081.1 hypothetical protein J6590_017250 [Homalodisca vitripennis]
MIRIVNACLESSREQCLGSLRYHTVSGTVVMVVAGVIPLDLLVVERWNSEKRNHSYLAANVRQEYHQSLDLLSHQRHERLDDPRHRKINIYLS